ncbi:tetratricopeptide repeat protein [Inquilinus limosus]|uniref:tetratricopeptide repeat protein n=1 Tax=Inquilinus limosus TaxID=171674 RepID=UPI000400A14E|nr:tetratricopeptide repeat protein [Inquilinus limosus]
MTDIFREVDEALREDRVKAIWNRYGRLIVAGAVAIVLGTAAFVGWRSYSQSQAQSQTRALVDAQQQAAADPQNAASIYAAVAADSSADRAALARLLEARADLDAGKRDEAGKTYEQIAGDSGVNPVVRDLARLYAVTARLDDGDPAALDTKLAPLAADGSPWRASARELQGLLALRQGDKAKAREIFEALAKDPASPPGVRSRADQLLSISSN